MADSHCPGQDLRTWKPEDIIEVPCPTCGNPVEIWKDEPVRTCRLCHNPVPNPRMNRGCAQWCSHSKECQASTTVNPEISPTPPPTTNS